jgi:hypothetical protein
VRTPQAGAVLSALAMLVAATGLAPALLLASLLLGIGYGPSPPAGGRILAATAPPGHRTLIFSIKQAGAKVAPVPARGPHGRERVSGTQLHDAQHRACPAGAMRIAWTRRTRRAESHVWRAVLESVPC